MLGRTSTGLTLYTAHMHAPVVAELRETEGGDFATVAGASPFPLAMRIEVPSPGRLMYTWSFGERDGKSTVRIVGDVTLVA